MLEHPPADLGQGFGVAFGTAAVVVGGERGGLGVEDVAIAANSAASS
ncbi:hypothetical protein [Pseudonocardia sp. NPDC049154]